MVYPISREPECLWAPLALPSSTKRVAVVNVEGVLRVTSLEFKLGFNFLVLKMKYV